MSSLVSMNSEEQEESYKKEIKKKFPLEQKLGFSTVAHHVIDKWNLGN